MINGLADGRLRTGPSRCVANELCECVDARKWTTAAMIFGYFHRLLPRSAPAPRRSSWSTATTRSFASTCRCGRRTRATPSGPSSAGSPARSARPAARRDHRPRRLQRHHPRPARPGGRPALQPLREGQREAARPGRRRGRHHRPQLRVPDPKVRRGLRQPVSRRVLHAARGRAGDGPDHGPRTMGNSGRA